FRNLSAVLMLLVIVFVLFLGWDVFKIAEYGSNYKRQDGESIRSYVGKFRREIVTLGWTVAFTSLYIIFERDKNSADSILIAAIVFTILYRVNKKYAMFGYLARLLVAALLGLWKVLQGFGLGDREKTNGGF